MVIFLWITYEKNQYRYQMNGMYSKNTVHAVLNYVVNTVTNMAKTVFHIKHEQMKIMFWKKQKKKKGKQKSALDHHLFSVHFT